MIVSRSSLVALVPVVLAVACADPATAPVGPTSATSLAKSSAGAAPSSAESRVRAYMVGANRALAAAGVPMAIDHADLHLGGLAAQLGAGSATVFADDRTHHSAVRWVPGDARRAGRTTLTYGVFAPGMRALTKGNATFDAEPAVHAAAATWNAVACSKLKLERRALPASVIPSLLITNFADGATAYRNDIGAVDVAVVGWLPGERFANLDDGAGARYVGVTFTSHWTSGPGSEEPTDVDHDGNADEARVEIWFQNGGPNDYRWTPDASDDYRRTGYDAQSEALHELGHALDLTHFGTVVFGSDGSVAASPLAVMNAAAGASLRAPLGPDMAGLCGNFAAWPKK